MSQHQHRSLERGQESTQEEKQPVNKEKSELGGSSSFQVRLILKKHIYNKQHRNSGTYQDLREKSVSNDSCYFGDSPLRRAETSESNLKLQPKRSLTGRQNPLQRKTSAPPAAKAPESMALSPSSAPVFSGSSSPDKQMNLQDPSSRLSPHMIVARLPRADSLLQTEIQNPVHCHPYGPVMHSQILHFPYVAVPCQWAIMPHRPLSKAQSVPSYFQQLPPVHTQAYMVTQPMYQQHTFPEKVPDHPMCPGELGTNRQQQSPHDERWSNRLEIQQEYKWECGNKVHHRNLTRVQSFPINFGRTLEVQNVYTGLVYDPQIIKSNLDTGDFSFPSDHERISRIWSRLQKCGLMKKCKWLIGRNATTEELKPCQCQTSNKDWSNMLLKMVGSVVDLTLCVATGQLKNGFAVVSPPGHHAGCSETCGSSVFNCVAIAAKQLQERLNVKKILIVDWDVHHGSGTEQIFYTDPHVLCISIHRFDNGDFFPGTGDPRRVGSKNGEGFNVNVALSGGLSPPMGDAEYLAAFRAVIRPIANEFSPDVVLVSAGFNAAPGNSSKLGGYKVSAKCFGYMTRRLMELAEGRVVLVLEGGCDPTSLCDASQACVSALLENEPEPLSEEELRRSPCANAVSSLERVLNVQGRYWGSLSSVRDTVSLSHFKAERRYSAGSEAAFALGSLTMTVPDSRFQLPNEPVEHDETKADLM